MNKRAIFVIIVVFLILIIIAEAIAIWNFAPKKIFKDLSEETVADIYVLFGDNETYHVPREEVNDLFLGLLRRVTLYGYVRESAPRETVYGIFFPIWMRIELKNGKSYEIREAGPYVIVNGKWFYTDYYALDLLRGKYDGWRETARSLQQQ